MKINICCFRPPRDRLTDFSSTDRADFSSNDRVVYKLPRLIQFSLFGVLQLSNVSCQPQHSCCKVTTFTWLLNFYSSEISSKLYDCLGQCCKLISFVVWKNLSQLQLLVRKFNTCKTFSKLMASGREFSLTLAA